MIHCWTFKACIVHNRYKILSLRSAYVNKSTEIWTYYLETCFIRIWLQSEREVTSWRTQANKNGLGVFLFVIVTAYSSGYGWTHCVLCVICYECMSWSGTSKGRHSDSLILAVCDLLKRTKGQPPGPAAYPGKFHLFYLFIYFLEITSVDFWRLCGSQIQ